MGRLRGAYAPLFNLLTFLKNNGIIILLKGCERNEFNVYGRRTWRAWGNETFP